MKRSIISHLIAALTVAVVLAGCIANSGCTSASKSPVKLTEGGAYEGDVLLFQFDQSAQTAKKIIGNFLQWEMDNRAMLAEHPEVIEFATKLRAEVPPTFRRANAARRAYLASKSAQTAGDLNTSLLLLNTLVIQATQILVERQAATSSPTP